MLRRGARYIARNDRGDGEMDEKIGAAYTALADCSNFFFPLFEFYAALGGFCGVIGLNSYTQVSPGCRTCVLACCPFALTRVPCIILARPTRLILPSVHGRLTILPNCT